MDPTDPTRTRSLDDPKLRHQDLLEPIFRHGRPVYEPPPLQASRDRVQAQLASLHPAIKRHLNPHEYPVGLAVKLHQLRVRLIQEARQEKAVAKGAAR